MEDLKRCKLFALCVTRSCVLFLNAMAEADKGNGSLQKHAASRYASAATQATFAKDMKESSKITLELSPLVCHTCIRSFKAQDIFIFYIL